MRRGQPNTAMQPVREGQIISGPLQRADARSDRPRQRCRNMGSRAGRTQTEPFRKLTLTVEDIEQPASAAPIPLDPPRRPAAAPVGGRLRLSARAPSRAVPARRRCWRRQDHHGRTADSRTGTPRIGQADPHRLSGQARIPIATRAAGKFEAQFEVQRRGWLAAPCQTAVR